jgi:Zinc carboxypeptidase
MYPKTVRLVNFGRSAEGRDIFGMTISSAEDDKSKEENREKKKKKKRRLRKQKDKLGFVIQGAQHAREVLTVIPIR